MKKSIFTLALVMVMALTSTLASATDAPKPEFLLYNGTHGDVYLETSEAGALSIYTSVLEKNGYKKVKTLDGRDSAELTAAKNKAVIIISTEDRFENANDTLFEEKRPIHWGCTAVFQRSADKNAAGGCYLDYNEAIASLAKLLQ